MNVYRCPPSPMPSERDMRVELAVLRRELGCEDYVSQHTVRVCYPALDALLDEATREELARRRAAEARSPWDSSRVDSSIDLQRGLADLQATLEDWRAHPRESVPAGLPARLAPVHVIRA